MSSLVKSCSFRSIRAVTAWAGAIAVALAPLMLPLAAQAQTPPIPPRGGGSRGGICIVSPDLPMGMITIWNDHPLFVWDGSVGRIEVQDMHNTLLWTATPEADDRTLLYTGEPLESGQTYRWLVFEASGEPLYRIAFQMMAADQRQEIQADLNALMADLATEQADDATITLRRIDYFASQSLWSDAMQEAFGMDSPSPAIAQYQALIYTELCR